MTALRCHILFPFRQGPWGGSNSFMSGLRERLVASGHWAETPEAADVVIFDSFNDAPKAMAWKRRLPGVPFVHRIDGPISAYRGADLHLDRLIRALAEEIADGVIFQSEFSRAANMALGLRPERSTVILNAARDEHFVPAAAPRPAGQRIRIVASSWSSHWNKGFDVYRFLDDNLDFSRYEMTFVGNSPVSFARIRHLPAQDHAAMAAVLREHDIFLTASRMDPCSNAVLEAIACGLPVLALDSGGHPELVAGAGRLFSGTGDVLAAIDAIAAECRDLAKSLERRRIAEVADCYLAFCEQVRDAARPAKRLGLRGLARVQGWLAVRQLHRVSDKVRRMTGMARDQAA
jgi:glycosyltransferase involved in cell wall biosynthesis